MIVSRILAVRHGSAIFRAYVCDRRGSGSAIFDLQSFQVHGERFLTAVLDSDDMCFGVAAAVKELMSCPLRSIAHDAFLLY